MEKISKLSCSCEKIKEFKPLEIVGVKIENKW